MTPDLISALIGFGGAIVGGLMQSAFSYFQSGQQFVRETRHRDYNLFVEAIAGMSQPNIESAEKEKFKAKLIEANARILLKSSPKVIFALCNYSRHSILSGEVPYTDFSKLLEAMRADIGGKYYPSFASAAAKILFEGVKS